LDDYSTGIIIIIIIIIMVCFGGSEVWTQGLALASSILNISMSARCWVWCWSYEEAELRLSLCHSSGTGPSC
jgi:hypothetical protein